MSGTGIDMTGRTVAGFRLEAMLGSGGTGVVYLAGPAERRVAVKVVNPWLGDDPVLGERLLREARLAMTLEHPNILPVTDAGEDQGVVYLVMPYVAGGDLRRVLIRDGALEPRRAVKVIAAVLDALDAAHEQGLVHRDVKPGNVLIEPLPRDEERVYLSDFGLAQHAQSTDLSVGGRGVVGSVDYMAPEQVRGAQVDHRCDIYAAGCLLYQCLSGSTPYRGSDVAVIWAKLHQSVPRLAAERPELARFDAVIAHATALDLTIATRPRTRLPTTSK